MSRIRATLAWYIDEHYNTQRIHPFVGFKSPTEYEIMAA